MRAHIKIFSIVLAAVFLCSFAAVSANAAPTSDVNVSINGRAFKGGTILKNETTCVPIRSFSLELDDCSVSWNDKTKTATVKTDRLTVTATSGSHYIVANGRYLYSNTAVFISDGTMYIPIRSLAAAFDATVGWNASSFTAIITSGNGAIESGDEFYDASDVYWLSRIICAESGNEPFLGKIAVGNVVLNRVVSSEYPDNIYDVIFDTKYGRQFTPTGNGRIYYTPNADSVIAAKICLEGYSLSRSMLFFLDPSIATNFWIMNNCTYVMTIGGHWFYA